MNFQREMRMAYYANEDVKRNDASVAVAPIYKVGTWNMEAKHDNDAPTLWVLK